MRVLFLDLDTLRPDHLGCYGYQRATSPNIDSIAREGVVFENYYCSDAPCLPSRSALISGRFGIHNGAVGHGGTAADQKLEGKSRGFRSEFSQNCLPGIFRKAGCKTVSISPFAERHSSFWFYAGFNEIYNTGKEGHESAEEVTPVVLDWIERNGKSDNWFLHVNYWDAHTPYRAPSEFGNPFEKEPLNTWMTDEIITRHRKDAGPHGALEINMFNNHTSEQYPRQLGEVRNIGDYKRLVDGYDCGIAFMDSQIGMIFEKLRSIGVWNNLAIIISSDHGENLGELNSYSEHSTADYPTCRIPLIIKWDGCRKGHIDNCLHYNLDLLPTLADILNISPWDKWDGESYKSAIFEGARQQREYLVLSQCAHVCQRSALFDGYLYIRTYHDGFHTYEKEMLFNLKDDPYEQYDLSKTHRDLCYKAAYYLADWYDRMMETSEDGIDPMRTILLEGGPYHTIGHLNRYCDYLIGTGRQEQANRLLGKYSSQ